VPIIAAFLEGWRRVLRAPRLSLTALAAMFLIALPMALGMRGALQAHLGASSEADRAVEGWRPDWAAEFGAQAQGVARTFTHEILGFGGTISIVSDLIDREALSPPLVAAATTSILVWVFLSGGILDRLARGRPVGAAHFFGVSAVFFWRFLRLGVLIGAAYWALFRWLHPWLFEDLYGRWTRDVMREGDGIAIRVALYGVLALALGLVSVVADFAKVRAVVEDRRSMVGAVGAALRFVRRRAVRVSGLYLLNGLAFVAILVVWRWTAPSGAASPWLALLVTQVYLLARVWAKLAFMASEVVFFQGELAHAHYTAAPDVVWPDSPAAEAIDNLARSPDAAARLL
jgi:hypothetical protein